MTTAAPETLPLIETGPGATATDRMAADLTGYGHAGRPSRGRGRRAQRQPIEYRRQLREAQLFYEEVLAGDIPIDAGRFYPSAKFNMNMGSLQEALSTSDFPLLFGDIIDRKMLARYHETEPTWRNWANTATVPDFRTVKRFAVDGSEATLATVAQGVEYPESKLTDLYYSYAVAKYGRRLPFFWETIINDDLNGFADAPDRLARACRRTQEFFATGLIASSTGPNATFFSAGHKNKISGGGSVLTISSLQSAFALLLAQVDTEGHPIEIDGVELVVPPQLEIPARNILQAFELWVNENGGTTGSQLHTKNWMQDKVSLSVNYYLPIVDTTTGTTAWYLFASPKSTRPALEIGLLRGHEDPELFRKVPNSMRVGGSGGDVLESFEDDTIDFKCRLVIGGTLMDYRSAVVSLGA